MNIDEELKAKLQKIKALADRWVGGEKENAKRMLAKLCEENGIHLSELEDVYILKLILPRIVEPVIANIVYSMIWSDTFNNIYEGGIFTMRDNYKDLLVEAKWPSNIMLELKVWIEHYVQLYRDNRESIIESIPYSFCDKYSMRNIETNGEGASISDEERDKIIGLSRVMRDDDWPRKRLISNN